MEHEGISARHHLDRRQDRFASAYRTEGQQESYGVSRRHEDASQTAPLRERWAENEPPDVLPAKPFESSYTRSATDRATAATW